MPVDEEKSFIEKIKYRRRFASVQSSDSDNDVQIESDREGVPCFKTISMQDSGIQVVPSVATDPVGTSTALADVDVTRCHVDCTSTELENGPLSESVGETAHSKLARNIEGELPFDIFYINEKTKGLQAFESFTELSEYLVDVAADEVVDKAIHVASRECQNVRDKIVTLPLETISSYISVGEYLRYLYEEDKLMDVSVHVKDRTFAAHRVALSCYSEYFQELFSSNKGKQIPFEMRLRGIAPEAFAVFLEFIYTGQLKIYDAIAADLIIIADFLKVETLKQRCSDLTENLPLDQALKLVVKYQGNCCTRIYRTVFQKILQNFTEISQLPGFLELDIDTLCQILSSDDLFVQTEYEVFQMAVRWLAHNIEERFKFATRVMNLVRFYYMNTEELFTCTETTSLIRGYDKFREVVLIANWVLTTRLLKRDDPFQFSIPSPRHCYRAHFNKANEYPEPYSSKINLPPKGFPNIVTASDVQHSPMPSPLMMSSPNFTRKDSIRSGASPKPTTISETQHSPLPSPLMTPTPNYTRKDSFAPEAILRFSTTSERQPSPVPSPQTTSTPKYTRKDSIRPEATSKLSTTSTRQHAPVPSPQMTSTPKPTRKDSIRPEATSERHPFPVHPPMTSARTNSSKDNFLPDSILKSTTPLEGEHTPRSSPVMTSTPKQPSSGKHAKPVMLPVELQTQAKSPARAIDILVIGGFNSANDEFVERYDSEDNQWVHFCRLPEPRRHHAVAVLGSKLYLIGGSDPRIPGAAPVPTKSTFMLDLSNKEWRKVCALNVPRMDHCVCTLLGLIYAIGGKGMYDNTLGSVECYNPVTNNWFFVAPLSRARSCAAASTLAEKIFVVGGQGASNGVPSTLNVLNTVEVFDPKQNSWSPRSNLRFPRCNASLVNVKDRLFLCGGATRSYDYKNSVLISVASLDEYIAEHNMWCHRTDMIIPRHDAGVTVAGERIYIVGGVSSTEDRVLQSIECYDTLQALWLSGVQDLPNPTRWISCASVVSKFQRPSSRQT